MSELQDPPAGPCTYAVGDLHGEVGLLRRLLELLPLRDEDTLVFLGDYVDRGENTVATLEVLRELERQRRCVFLCGNHEDAWLDVWDGTRLTRIPEIGGARKAWHEFGGEVPQEVGFWLARTRVDYEDEHAYYVHAGVLPGMPFDKTSRRQKLLGAGNFMESDYDWGKPVVFGHWPLSEPLLRPNKIGIDTVAYRSGILTAVRMPDRRIFQARR